MFTCIVCHGQRGSICLSICPQLPRCTNAFAMAFCRLAECLSHLSSPAHISSPPFIRSTPHDRQQMDMRPQCRICCRHLSAACLTSRKRHVLVPHAPLIASRPAAHAGINSCIAKPNPEPAIVSPGQFRRASGCSKRERLKTSLDILPMQCSLLFSRSGHMVV